MYLQVVMKLYVETPEDIKEIQRDLSGVALMKN